MSYFILAIIVSLLYTPKLNVYIALMIYLAYPLPLYFGHAIMIFSLIFIALDPVREKQIHIANHFIICFCMHNKSIFGRVFQPAFMIYISHHMLMVMNQSSAIVMDISKTRNGILAHLIFYKALASNLRI